ncbi:MAG: hypothetical protein IT290_04730 [Deltaproteobacteria bacterium]|nr:hypothetical protein [Deltaproteobacteria bacterium]
MKKDELQQALVAEGIRPNIYCLSGHVRDEQYVLAFLPDGSWEVYYSERGNKNDLERFMTEEEACHRLFERVCADSSSQRTGG